MPLTRPGLILRSETTTRNSPASIGSGVGVNVPRGICVGVRLGPAVRVVVGSGVEVMVAVAVWVAVGEAVFVGCSVLIFSRVGEAVAVAVRFCGVRGRPEEAQPAAASSQPVRERKTKRWRCRDRCISLPG